MATATFTDDVVSLPNGRSQVVFRGGNGDPVVYLHGGGGLVLEDPLLAALARSSEVIAPLAPGFADLADLDEIQDVHELAMHYDDLFEALGLDGVPVVGHSFGGMTAAELAAHYPRRTLDRGRTRGIWVIWLREGTLRIHPEVDGTRSTEAHGIRPQSHWASAA